MSRNMRLFVLALLICTAGTWAAADTINWGQFGTPGDLVSTGAVWTSAGGAQGEVGILGSIIGTQNMIRIDQGNWWNGNFDPGEMLLWNEGPFGMQGYDFGLHFYSPVMSVTVPVQANYYGAFTATVTAWDAYGNVISVVTANGISDTNPGTGLKMTVTGTGISWVGINVVDINGGDDMAIGHVTFGSTPEPGTLLMLGSGVLGLFGYGRRRLGL